MKQALESLADGVRAVGMALVFAPLAAVVLFRKIHGRMWKR